MHHHSDYAINLFEKYDFETLNKLSAFSALQSEPVEIVARKRFTHYNATFVDYRLTSNHLQSVFV